MTTPIPTLSTRCTWSTSAPDYIDYHDNEWGRPVYSDMHMFEHLFLETFQSGLSWLLILRRRPAFHAAFHAFNPAQIATMNDADVERLASDPSIVRNRPKIRAAIGNAKAVLKMKEEEGLGLAEYFWRWVGFVSIDRKRESEGHIQSKDDLSERIAADLKARGFRFVGPTVIYAHLQATGIINDHVIACHQHQQCLQSLRSLNEWRSIGVDVEKKVVMVKKMGLGFRKGKKRRGGIENPTGAVKIKKTAPVRAKNTPNLRRSKRFERGAV